MAPYFATIPKAGHQFPGREGATDITLVEGFSVWVEDGRIFFQAAGSERNVRSDGDISDGDIFDDPIVGGVQSLSDDGKLDERGRR